MNTERNVVGIKRTAEAVRDKAEATDQKPTDDPLVAAYLSGFEDALWWVLGVDEADNT